MKRIVKFLLCLWYKIKNIRKCKIKSSAIILGRCKFEGKNRIEKHSYIKNCNFGLGSYCGTNNIIINTEIGRYCSIGSNVKIISATHPTSMVSTHPAFYSIDNDFHFAKRTIFQEILKNESGRSVEIGNDVWIGNDVLIKGGIKIGDGAVIAMGAVVTKDVAPYSIVGGVPAKIIKKRFTDEQISWLLKFKWWEKDMEWLERHVERFAEIDIFIKENNK